MKEKITELVKESAVDLGIKTIRLAGETLIRLAESLAHSHTTRIIQADKINPEDLRRMKDPLVARPANV